MQRELNVERQNMDDCCIEYRIFTQINLPKESEEYEDKFCTLLIEYTAFVSQIIGDYIWQNEAFNLKLAPKIGNDVPCLCGQTSYGDNVEDEWFIVFLLFQLSAKYPDITISVNDTDGNFLLIEAAHHLPRWLNPENSDNRVFIHGGQVHMIPFPSTPREITIFPTGTPTLSSALEIVNGPCNTLADCKIQQAIIRRIEGYPEKASESYHHANCLVPPPIKYLLNCKPSLVSAAVQAFCHRDPIDMKAIKESKYFPPSERVLTRVRFTKCLYAQIMQQNFHSDKKSGWVIPAVSSQDYKPHQIGMKLTCGFEILCSKSTANKNSDKPSGPQWNQFLGFLTQQGYFRGEIEGSILYNKLLRQAENHFADSPLSHHDTDKTIGDVILSLLDDIDIDIDEMREEAKTLPAEDDDKWLDITAEDLDVMLRNYSATGSTTSMPSDKTNGHWEKDFNLESVTQKMKSFVDKVSSHEGAEFPGGNESQEIDFDADSFMDTMRQILERRPLPNDDSDEDDDNDELFSDVSDEEEEEDVSMEPGELQNYMKNMDKELAQTKIGESFEKAHPSSTGSPDENDPVDVDLNLVKNFLESFSSQQGLAGPAANILNAMGLVLPRDDDDDDGDGSNDVGAMK